MADNFYGITNAGRVRENNEDTYMAETLPNGWIVACVIDGVGGYEGGEVAAEIARVTLLNTLRQSTADPLQTLQNGILKANTAIYEEKMQGRGNGQMACVLTVSLVDVQNNQFFYAHVGDTRLYLLRDQSLVKVTKDHSFVGFLEDSGRLSEKEAMDHPKRNEINKALGFDPQIDIKTDYVETGFSPFLPGDLLMLCSDGLSDLVDKHEMTTLLLSGGSLAERCQSLVDAANVAGGKDNITVVIVANQKKPLKIKATKPAGTKKNGTNESPVTTQEIAFPVEKVATTPTKKGTNPLVVFLLVLCFMLAGTSVWLWWQKGAGTNVADADIGSNLYIHNTTEKAFADSLALAQKSFNTKGQLSTTGIVLGDTLFVRQDSMHINGNGLVLQSDSTYNGPAIFVTANNKWLILENLTFKDFKTAVLLQAKGVQLKNVQFQNCTVPVQHQLFLPADRIISGAVRDTFITKKDSLPN